MTQNYILIDYENVQPKNLEILKKHPFKIFVFLGASQKSIATKLAVSLQKFGANADYVQISGNGKNALDFHIAYYIGKLSQRDPKGIFYIISKDTGFDPLVKHLKSKKIVVYRKKDLTYVPTHQICSNSSDDEKFDAVIKKLVSMEKSRPRLEKTLADIINRVLGGDLSENSVKIIINDLKHKKFISVKNENVSYNLPN